MNKLSVCLAIYNEEKNLARCLESVKSIADEIVVVDGGSVDSSVAIAKKYNARVIVTSNPPIFHINKQKALEACSSPWILQLDADEVVSESLADEILKVISLTDDEIRKRTIRSNKQKLFSKHQKLIEKRDVSANISDSIVAFYIPRRNYFLGHPMAYAGLYPDGVIRLVKKNMAKFPCRSVHEQIEVFGQVSWLSEDLLHFSNDTLKKYLLSADKYTSLFASHLNDKNVVISMTSFVTYLVILPFKTFFLLYIRHKGILDGFYGFIFCTFSAFHYPIAFLKYIYRIKES